jgi:hypothetical protein
MSSTVFYIGKMAEYGILMIIQANKEKSSTIIKKHRQSKIFQSQCLFLELFTHIPTDVHFYFCGCNVNKVKAPLAYVS